MTEQEIEELKKHQLWRQGDNLDLPMLSPSRVTELIDKAIKSAENNNSQQTRIEETEKALTESNSFILTFQTALKNTEDDAAILEIYYSNKKLLDL